MTIPSNKFYTQYFSYMTTILKYIPKDSLITLAISNDKFDYPNFPLMTIPIFPRWPFLITLPNEKLIQQEISDEEKESNFNF